MIQITNNNIPQGETLESLANQHFGFLNQKCKTGKRKDEYKKKSISYLLENALLNSKTPLEKKYYAFLIKNKREILIGKPKKLQGLVNYFNNNFPKNIFSKYDKATKKNIKTEIDRETKKIFNYPNYRGSDFCCNYLAKIGFLDRKPCPYCNLDEVYVISYKNINKKTINKALLDLDHFIPQSKFPFLALSFYNLIPSCHNCNSIFKGDKLFSIDTHINPFEQDFDELFTFGLTSPFSILLDVNDFDFKVTNKKPFSSKIISDLLLLERYKSEKKSLYRDLKIILNNTQSKRAEIYRMFNETEINNQVFHLAKIPKEKEDIPKYKLGKLKRDICINNGII